MLDDVEHPNEDKYPNQRVFVINIDDYVHLVSRKEIFLKTVIPSRKTTKQYLGENMSNPKLSKEEKEILKDFEAGEFKSVLTPERRKMLQETAEETFKKDKRINIRISSRDLESLQRRALEEGIPYQTLVASVLHKSQRTQRRAAEFNVMRYPAHRSRILDFCHVTHYICVHDQNVRGQAYQVLV